MTYMEFKITCITPTDELDQENVGEVLSENRKQKIVIDEVDFPGAPS